MRHSENEALNDIYLNEKVLNYVYHGELHVGTKEGSYDLTKQSLGQLSLPTGRIVANVHTYSYAIGGIDDGAENNVAAFSSGWGDGCYPSYFGFDDTGEPCALVTDFLILD